MTDRSIQRVKDSRRSRRVGKIMRTAVAEALESRCLLSAGVLDPTFGTGGVTTSDINGQLNVNSSPMVRQSDGKLILGTSVDDDFGLARYNANGTLDTTFGNGGYVRTDFNDGSEDGITSLALLPDGDIVAVGATNQLTGVAVYKPNGSLDTSFNGTGEEVVDFANGDGDLAGLGHVATDSSGNIILVGGDTAANESQSGFAVARLTPTGQLDPTFNGTGEEIISFGAGVFASGTAVTVAGDGQIVIAGDVGQSVGLVRVNTSGGVDNQTVFSSPSFFSANSVVVDATGNAIVAGTTSDSQNIEVFGVARFNATGIDPTFGNGGLATVDFGPNTFAASSQVVLGPSNTIVVVGIEAPSPDVDLVDAVGVLNSDGSADVAFNGTGQITVSPGAGLRAQAPSVAIDSSGNIIVGGSETPIDPIAPAPPSEFTLVGLTSTGAPDAAFAGGAVELAPFISSQELFNAESALTPGGQIVVAATGLDSNTSYLSLFNADGTLDTSFGSGGYVQIPDPIFTLAASGVAVSSGGTIFVGGTSNGNFEVFAYNANGTPDAAFNGGEATVNFAGNTAVGGAIAVDAGGNVVVVGGISGGLGDFFGVARLTSAGTLDSSFNATGQETIDVGGEQDSGASAVVIDPNGDIDVAGSAVSGSNYYDYSAVIRLTPIGGLDPSFGNTANGVTLVNFPGGGGSTASAIAVDPAGDIAFTGFAADQNNYQSMTVGVLNGDGTPDTSFNGTGQTALAFNSHYTVGNGIAFDQNGDVIVVGTSDGGDVLAMAEFNPNGSLNASFGSGGTVSQNLGGSPMSALNSVAVDSNNRIVVGGWEFVSGQGEEEAVARYLNGTDATSLSVSSATTLYGSSASLSATVTSSLPVTTGSVTFTILDSLNNTVATVVAPVSNGVATASLSPIGINAGSYTIDAAYTDSGPIFGASSGSAALTVSTASLTVTAASASIVYGATIPTFSVSYSGFVNSDGPANLGGNLTLATTAASGSSVGNYPITASGLTSSNYSINYQPGTLAITQANLTVTAAIATSVYGAALPVFSGTIVGLQNGDPITATYTTIATSSSGVGSYLIIPVLSDPGSKLSNYNLTLTDGSLTITPAALTIMVNNANIAQGSPLPTFTVSYIGFVNNDSAANLTGTLSFSTAATPTSPAGNYGVTASGLSSTNYTIAYQAGTLSITQSALIPLTVTVNHSTAVYGSALPAFTVSYSGFAAGDSPASLGGTLIFTDSAVQGSPVGNYVVSASGLTSSKYAIMFQSGTLSITQAALSVTVNNATGAYGSALPSFSVSYSGFVNGDAPASLSGTLSLATTAVVGSAVGSYPITASGLVSTNYSITYHAGTLSITRATLLVTVTNATRAYGAANPTFSATFAGLYSGDNITATFATTATLTSPVGNYPITATLVDPGHKLSNYTTTLVAGTLTVKAAALTVSATAKTKVYGQANPTLTGTTVGLVNGDTITVTFSTTATKSSGVGAYAITPTVSDPNHKLSNYTLTVVPSTLTVTAAALTITANNQTKIYGSANPSLTVSYSGFVNGDTSSVLTKTPTLTTTATASSNVGAYAITPSAAVAANYAITYVSGSLTITPATLYVEIDPSVSIKLIGQPDPNFTVTYIGFVLGQNASVLGGTLVISTNLTTKSPIGIYEVTASGLTSTNYNIVYIPGLVIELPSGSGSGGGGGGGCI